MKNTTTLILFLGLSGLASNAFANETDCTDGKDNDGDTVYDCGDSDCKSDAACQPDGKEENTDSRCSDWIDNDGNGFADCDDFACQSPSIPSCLGSMDKKAATGGSPAADTSTSDDVPTLGKGMSVEDLIGKGNDNDGERNDVVCSDGIDNDNDGRTDCADFGCRFDPTVTVCQGDPDFRFSVVGRVEMSHDAEQDITDTRFSTLQLRAFGPMPYIQDSFFLLSMRAEKTPRLTFAMFQVPIGKKGHYLNINSGSGGLSTALVRSAHKQLLLQQPFYLYSAFEQGNGAAMELGGPLDSKGRFLYRTYASGGTGRFSGNVGGGYFSDDQRNFSWSVGAQLHANLIGYFSRWDSPMLYTSAPAAFAVSLGAKYDERPSERYPAFNINATFRYKRLILIAENYTKRELEFKSWQYAYNVQAGFLLVPKRLLLAADFGEYLVGDFENLPDGAALPEDLTRQLQETQARVALHVYLWKNIFVGSLLFVDRRVDPRPGEDDDQLFREIKAVAQYRF